MQNRFDQIKLNLEMMKIDYVQHSIINSTLLVTNVDLHKVTDRLEQDRMRRMTDECL